MIAQVIFTALLFVVLVYAWTAYRQAPLVGLLVVIAAIAGKYFVWFPSHSMVIAEWAGIGRGVDLIIYTWVIISLFVVFSLHLKMRSQTELLTKLTRAIALAEYQNAQDGSTLSHRRD